MREQRSRLLPALAAAGLAVGVLLAGCSGGSGGRSVAQPRAAATPSHSPTPKPKPTIPPPRGAAGAWVTAVVHKGRPEIQTQTLDVAGSSVVVLRADAPTTKLVLHAGYEDPGGVGWPAGAAITDQEKPKLLAAFNGGFRLGLGQGGFDVLGRKVGAIQPGLASVVTYADGSSGLGIWGRDVPQHGKRIVSVRQNLGLLVDAGKPAADIGAYAPWGATLGGGFAVARSGLGIDKYGNLLWAGSSFATPSTIAEALIRSGAVRAMQLDINPMWVVAFTFPNTHTQKVALPSQSRPLGTYLQPYSRDFFTVALRP